MVNEIENALDFDKNYYLVEDRLFLQAVRLLEMIPIMYNDNIYAQQYFTDMVHELLAELKEQYDYDTSTENI